MQTFSFGTRAVLCAVAGLALTSAAHASVMYGTAGSTYTQNFDTLPNTPTDTNLQVAATPMKWADDTTPSTNVISIPGWYLYFPIDLSSGEGGTNGHQRMRIGSGSANTGAFMSFGSAGSTDRALGDVGSNTLGVTGADIYIAIRLTNTTGSMLDTITVGYAGEQWRDGGNNPAVAQTMTFAYSLDSTATVSSANSLYTNVSSLNFTSPVAANTGSGAAVNGNTVGRTVIAPVTISGLDWEPGTDLWLRWDDINNTGNDHGLAIDDFSFSATATAAVPEPASAALVSIMTLPLIARRRRGN
jgi:hypothetical protein